MKHIIFLSVLLSLSASVLANPVVYTDSQHLPENLPVGSVVVLLDAPARLQKEIFGQLSSNPQQAAAQATILMSSPEWQDKQQQLLTSYRQVVQAWELGIRKIPAIVFDDRDVVYGTTDVALAVALRQKAGGRR